MNLPYDPADGDKFWRQISQIPGYPAGMKQPMRSMVFGKDALHRLPATLLAAGCDARGPLLVVMDPTPMRRGPDDLKPMVLSLLRQAGWEVETLILPPNELGEIHADIPQAERVRDHIRPGISVLGVGSGVVTDLVKYASHMVEESTGKNIPTVVYATANSVIAYTSHISPIFTEGMKKSFPSRYLDALVCDTTTLADAPYDMTVAGVGDLLAVYVSNPDWYLAHRLGLDPSYSPIPQALLGPMDQVLLEHADGLRIGEPGAVEMLAKLLQLGGLVMSLTNATTPMSGYEHVMAHNLDLLAETKGRPFYMHGMEVALTTILSAETYRIFLERFDPKKIDIDACYPSLEAKQAEIRKAFDAADPSGQATRRCLGEYKAKLDNWYAHRAEFETFLQDWPEVKTELANLGRPPETLKAILREIGSPMRFTELTPPCPVEDVKFVYMNAPYARMRLTIGDLPILFGWDRQALWEEAWVESQK